MSSQLDLQSEKLYGRNILGGTKELPIDKVILNFDYKALLNDKLVSFNTEIMASEYRGCTNIDDEAQYFNGSYKRISNRLISSNAFRPQAQTIIGENQGVMTDITGDRGILKVVSLAAKLSVKELHLMIIDKAQKQSVALLKRKSENISEDDTVQKESKHVKKATRKRGQGRFHFRSES